MFSLVLICSDFGGGSPFTYWIKEHMDDYIDANYISFGAHYYSHLQQHSLLLSDDADDDVSASTTDDDVTVSFYHSS